MVTHILRSTDELEAVSEEWRHLYARASQGIFADYDWFKIWWDCLAASDPSNKLHVVTSSREGRLVGVLPLYVKRRKGLRVLQSGGHKAFNRFDMLAELESDACAVWKAAKESPHYDFADIREVYEGSTAYRALCTLAHARDVVPAFGLQLIWKRRKDFVPWLSSKKRYGYRNAVRRLEQKARYEIGICTEAPVPLEIVSEMVAHKREWAAREGKHGLFQHPNVHEFLCQLVVKAAEQNRLAMFWLRCGDKSFSYHLCFVDRGALVSSVIAHDPEWNDYSPGTTILVESIHWAIENGFACVESGQGGGYKVGYSNQALDCTEFTFARSLKGKVIEAVFFRLRDLSRAVRKTHPEAENVTRAAAKLRH